MADQIPNPALLFLNRGAQLIRLVQIVVANLQNQVLSEGRPIGDVADIIARSNAGTLADDVRAFFSKSRERVSDAEIIMQLFFSRTVDAFRIFLEDIVRAILQRTPAITPHTSGDLEDVMEELGSQKLSDFLKTVSRSYSFVFFPNGRDVTSISLVFALRNLITHQYGIVTKRFLTHYPHPNLAAGRSYPFTPQLIQEKNQLLLEMSKSISSRAAEQFSIRFGPTADQV